MLRTLGRRGAGSGARAHQTACRARTPDAHLDRIGCVPVALTIVVMVTAAVTAWMGRYPPRRFTELRRWTVAGLALVVGMTSTLLIIGLQ